MNAAGRSDKRVARRPVLATGGKNQHDSAVMGSEIERKFLVEGEAWRDEVVDSEMLVQGYLTVDRGITVRVRRSGNHAWLTIKGPAQGLTRAEFEYDISADEAVELLGLCQGRVVEKTRHRITHVGRVWEIDEFLGRSSGLIIAEAELQDPSDGLIMPNWAGQEVSVDPKYYNASLSLAPYCTWAAQKDRKG